MNNQTIRNYYDAFARIAAFGAAYGDQFAAASRGATLLTTMAEVVSQMEAEGVTQLSGTAEFRGGTDAKRAAADALRAEMREIRDTAQAISEAEGLPDFDDQFRMPRSYAHEVLLTAARNFLDQATAQQALFLEFEMPADFIAQLTEAIAELEAADDTQDAGRSEQVGGTAALRAELSRGIRTRNLLLPIVRNKFRDDASVLAQWETAARVVRRRSTPVPPTPPVE